MAPGPPFLQRTSAPSTAGRQAVTGSGTRGGGQPPAPRVSRALRAVEGVEAPGSLVPVPSPATTHWAGSGLRTHAPHGPAKPRGRQASGGRRVRRASSLAASLGLEVTSADSEWPGPGAQTGRRGWTRALRSEHRAPPVTKTKPESLKGCGLCFRVVLFSVLSHCLFVFSLNLLGLGYSSLPFLKGVSALA